MNEGILYKLDEARRQSVYDQGYAEGYAKASRATLVAPHTLLILIAPQPPQQAASPRLYYDTKHSLNNKLNLLTKKPKHHV